MTGLNEAISCGIPPARFKEQNGLAVTESPA
jgi:hypothetical protein